jgi:lipoprotein-anchoring transpeptidase ErfK/SrfK
MSLSRRDFLTSSLVIGFASPAWAEEPFPVNAKDATQVDYKYQRRDMEFATNEPAGTIVIDAVHRFLYHVQGNGLATRYGVAVGKATHAWTGEVIIKKNG